MFTPRYASRVPLLPEKKNTPAYNEAISLGGGYAFPEMLPDITEAAAEAARSFRVQSLQYGPHMGLPELREQIIRMLHADGVTAGLDNILILNGAKNGIDLALRLFVEPGDEVIVTRPNYATALHIFRNHEVSFVEIDMDRDGLLTDQLETVLQRKRSDGKAIPKILYVVPDFHNPAGITLSVARRKKLVQLADAHDFLIIEDDPYRHIRFIATALPPIQSFDTNGRVIGLGTVSKIFAPGIRIGWANASADIIRQMMAMKSDGGTSPFAQRVVSIMMKNGAIEKHTRELSEELKKHRDAMVAALKKYMPDVSYRVPQGGYYMWLELPPGIDCDKLTADAERSGVLIFSGRPYFADRTPTNFIRLCYSNCNSDEIERGVEILGDVMKRIDNAQDQRVLETAQTQHFD